MNRKLMNFKIEMNLENIIIFLMNNDIEINFDIQMKFEIEIN